MVSRCIIISDDIIWYPTRLNCQWGLQLEAGKRYEGFVIARASSGSSVDVRASLVRTGNNGTTANSTLHVLSSANMSLQSSQWTKLAFNFTPSAGSRCTGSGPSLPFFSGQTVACDGAFGFAVLTPGATVDLDFAFLHNSIAFLIPSYEILS